MGNDGGSIPTRRELVKEAARNPTTTELKEALHEKQDFYWTTDPLTNDALEPPIVSDALGRLFKKESVLEYLLQDDGHPRKIESDKILQGSVKSLKDVVEVKFEVDNEEKKNGSAKAQRYLCPMTRKPLGPKNKAVYLVPCGHAFSAAALKEVSGEAGGKCQLCDGSYAPNDVIPIIPTAEEDIARLQLRIQTLKDNGLSHSLKKDKNASKKRKKRDKEVEKDSEKAENNGPKDTAATTVTNGTAEDKKNPKPPKSSLPTGSNKSSNDANKQNEGIHNSAMAAITTKVMEEERAKRRKIESNENLKSLFTAGNQKVSMKNSNDFMTRGFSIPRGQKQD